MKRLKYVCPFHGRNWPLIAALIAGILEWCHALQQNWPEEAVRAVLLFVPLTVLIICFLIIQRPSRAERELIAKANYPLWSPADASVIRRIREEKAHFSNRMIRVLMYIGVFTLASVLPGKHGSEPNFGAAAFFVLLGGIILAADMLLRSRWKSVDQSAVMTVIPIDHMFDILHSRRIKYRWFERREWYTSYLVFYLPDGRYVLPAGSNAGYAKAIIVVQYNGMLAWLPTSEIQQEDYMQ